MIQAKSIDQKVLHDLIREEGLVEYIRDYYSARNGHLNIRYAQKNFYIAEDTTYQPWLSIMGHIPDDKKEQDFYDKLSDYIEQPQYVAVYTNIEQVAAFLQKKSFFSYHEDFYVALLSNLNDIKEEGIRFATENDLPFIEKTYIRSGHEQLRNRVLQNQMWVLEEENCLKGYAGIHKDCSLGFEYVAPNYRRQNVASRLQSYIAKQMIEKGLIPYVMISAENDIAQKLQRKWNGTFANNRFYFYAKGKYEFE